MNGEYVKKSNIGELVFKMKPQRWDYCDSDNYYTALQLWHDFVEQLNFLYGILLPSNDEEGFDYEY